MDCRDNKLFGHLADVREYFCDKLKCELVVRVLSSDGDFVVFYITFVCYVVVFCNGHVLLGHMSAAFLGRCSTFDPTHSYARSRH